MNKAYACWPDPEPAYRGMAVLWFLSIYNFAGLFQELLCSALHWFPAPGTPTECLQIPTHVLLWILEWVIRILEWVIRILGKTWIINYTLFFIALYLNNEWSNNKEWIRFFWWHSYSKSLWRFFCKIKSNNNKCNAWFITTMNWCVVAWSCVSMHKHDLYMIQSLDKRNT